MIIILQNREKGKVYRLCRATCRTVARRAVAQFTTMRENQGIGAVFKGSALLFPLLWSKAFYSIHKKTDSHSPHTTHNLQKQKFPVRRKAVFFIIVYIIRHQTVTGPVVHVLKCYTCLTAHPRGKASQGLCCFKLQMVFLSSFCLICKKMFF